MTFDILPNWHPFFVHYTIAFCSVGAVLYLGGIFAPLLPDMRAKVLLLARFCLWLGALLTLVTVLTGLYAFATVAHTASAHLPMIDHRNWALATALIGCVLGLLIFWQRNETQTSKVVAMLAGALFVLVMVTGYKGAELVYRYGVGVQTTPPAAAETHPSHDHDHDH